MNDTQFELFRRKVEQRFIELEADAARLSLETKSGFFNLGLYLGALTLFYIMMG